MKSTQERRKFLRQSTKAVGALLLPAYLSGCGSRGDNRSAGEPAPATQQVTNERRKLGVALVGLGGYSSGQLAPALQLTEHCELRGIVTGSPEKIPVWREKYGIPEANVYNYENMDEVANNDDIDVVYIVLPTSLHAQFAIRAAKAGKHVWCEKPMAMDVEECQAVIDACETAGVKLSIGYRMQHEPNTRTLIGYAESKPFGKMQTVKSEAGYGGQIPTSGWRSRPEMGGSALYDMGVYSINGLRYATGLEPLAVKSAVQYVPKTTDVTTSYELIFPDGIVAKGKASVVENTNILRVDCAGGWYELSPMQSYNGVEGRRSDGHLLNQPIESQQARQMDDDALAILNDTPVMVPGSEGLKDIRIVRAIIESAKTGKEVSLI
ncbi:glucose-fructose oxidoreductase [Lewinellaceae bacterium SD302]|nr:glucose-fructose oxidoreductase [Lewinellaceae bacterium SD302]